MQLILEGSTLSRADATNPSPSTKFKVALRMTTDSESEIKEVKAKSKRWRTFSRPLIEIASSQGFFPALKTASKRALYPFRRDALVGIMGVLDGLQGNLDTALALLQTYT